MVLSDDMIDYDVFAVSPLILFAGHSGTTNPVSHLTLWSRHTN